MLGVVCLRGAGASFSGGSFRALRIVSMSEGGVGGSLAASVELPPARQFKADSIINQLGGLAAGSFDDTVRITIPRAVRFIYDIASNRGARHDPSEINPNEMDAHAVVATTSWILAEMIRYAQKGALNPAEVKALVESLIEKKYPMLENVDGRTYVHVPGASARDIALLLLWQQHPKRMSRDELISAVQRHDFTLENSKRGVERLRGLVDSDAGGLRLLQPGVREADLLFARAQSASAPGSPRRRRRRRKPKARKRTL